MALPDIDINHLPIDLRSIQELIISGYEIDMVLDFDPDISAYLVYVKYNKNQITRQVISQRQYPRQFKDLSRAVDWGKRTGFRSMILRIDYENYPLPD